MVTEIKMKVTSDLSNRVQEIVLNNGGEWLSFVDNMSIRNTNEPYLYINKHKKLSCGDDKECFKDNYFKEVSAYDFIVSQGEQGWLPKYSEEALFSRDGQTWKKFKFLRYMVGSKYPFKTTNISAYKHCKPLPKTVNFIQFLKDNDVYKKYMNNIKIENQRWSNIEYYIQLQNLCNKSSKVWINGAFNWCNQPESYEYWNTLNYKWIEVYKNNKVVWDV